MSCKIEQVNDQCFALTEEGSTQALVATPASDSRASFEDHEGMPMARLTSEDRKSELQIFERGSDQRDPTTCKITSTTVL